MIGASASLAGDATAFASPKASIGGRLQAGRSKGPSMPTTKLFSPLTLRSLTLSNRIVVSPMAQYSADNGLANQWHLMHLGNLSIGGAGLVITEASSVEPRGRVSDRCLGIWSDDHLQALEPAIVFCRRHGAAKLGMQLMHSGRKGSVAVPWKKHVTLDEGSGGWRTVSPSDVPYPRRPAPVALDTDALAHVRESFADAARRANKLGFDLLEIHNAHGYLLHSFLSPFANHRNDTYGGSLENRMRYPLEVFDAVRDAWPAEKPLGVRISVTDWVDGGWTPDDSVAFARALKAKGCDYICASSGGSVPEQSIPVGPGYQVPLAEKVRREAGIPTIAVGLITEPEQAERILADGSADLVALGRGMLYDPRWAWHAAAQLGEEVYFPPQYERSHPSMRRGDFLKAFREK
jgi:2,4-dienoyl-CoA reductase-like NADH-dependent reductase (Old Yellow Enzyme family)